jgi:CrcB protein
MMGLLYVLFMERMAVAPELRAGVLIGLLGSFTTFSTFSIETLTLIEQADFLKAGLNILLSVSACILATWLGVGVARQL